MSKINYSKVEDSLSEGLLKMTMGKLLDMSDKAAGRDPSNKSDRSIQESLIKFQYNLKKLYKKDKALYEKIGVTPNEIKKLLENAAKLTAEDVKKIREVHEKLEAYLKSNPLPAITDAGNQDLVENEKIKHINKRFNVKDGWLPLK